METASSSESSGAVLGQTTGDYLELDAPVPLQAHVACIWTHRFAQDSPSTVAIVPDGSIDLQWMDGVLRVAGPDREVTKEIIRPGSFVVGFRFRPGAAHTWLGMPLSEIVGTRMSLDQFWGPEVRRLTDAIGDARTPADVADRLASALSRKARFIEPPDRALHAIFRGAGVLSGDESAFVRGLSSRLGFAERTLRRRCLEAFGYGPKTLARVLRFQRFMHLLRNSGGATSLASLAVDAGYCDQPHLNRETLRLAGLSPQAIRSQLSL